MEILRTPVKNGFLHSTPRFSYQDSGYFGSEAKSCSKNLFLALSPVHESPPRFKDDDDWPFSKNGFSTFTPLKYNYTCAFNHHQNIALRTPDVIRQLRFEESGIGNDSFNQSKKLKFATTPQKERYPDYLNLRLQKTEEKRKCGEHVSPNIKRKLDFLVNLKKRNCEVIISEILTNLSGEDLCRVCCVNSTWRNLVIEDRKANARRKEYLKSLTPEKENISRSSCDMKKGYVHFSLLPQVILSDISNCVQSQEAKVPSECSRFDPVFKESLGEMLKKCPMCLKAAKMKNDCEYICTSCHYSFCKKCLSPSSKTHMCPMLTELPVPMLIIGSKKSKKNLKRL